MWSELEHNSDEWSKVRSQLLTGSNAAKIMANYGKAFGDPAKKLAYSISVARITGGFSDLEGFSNAHTERGHAEEPEAIRLYEEFFFCEVERNLFFQKGKLGCSPDFARDNKTVIGDVKSVLPHVQVSTIKRGSIDPAYKWQAYFNTWLTEAIEFHYVSYCSLFPDDRKLFVRSVPLPDERVKEMELRISEFFDLVDDTMNMILTADMINIEG